jgi:hypothetical protein
LVPGSNRVLFSNYSTKFWISNTNTNKNTKTNFDQDTYEHTDSVPIFNSNTNGNPNSYEFDYTNSYINPNLYINHDFNSSGLNHHPVSQSYTVYNTFTNGFTNLYTQSNPLSGGHFWRASCRVGGDNPAGFALDHIGYLVVSLSASEGPGLIHKFPSFDGIINFFHTQGCWHL